MNIKVLYILFILVIIVNINDVEKFDELVVSSKEVEELNINISVEKVNELHDLLNYIKFGNNKPKLLNDIPDELQNLDIYNSILYEMYIEDYLDNYLVNRFNINKYLKVKYKYTNYYDKLYESIEELKNNIDNLDKFIFLKNSDNLIINLNDKINEVEVNNFNKLYRDDIKNYFDNVFKNLGLDDYFIYELVDLNNDNIVDIMDTLDMVIENEFNLFNNFLES